MKVAKGRTVAVGDRVSILPLSNDCVPRDVRTAKVAYVGPVYIRLDDGSMYATIGGMSLAGDRKTRIEPTTGDCGATGGNGFDPEAVSEAG